MFGDNFNSSGGGGFGGPIQGPGGFNSGLNIMGNGNILSNDGTSTGMFVNNSGSILRNDGFTSGLRIDNFGRISDAGGFNTGYSVPSMNRPILRNTLDPIFPKPEFLYREPYNPYKPKDYSFKNDYDLLEPIRSYKKTTSPSYLPENDFLSPKIKLNTYEPFSKKIESSYELYNDPIEKPYFNKKKYDPFQY
jgi:hypothetical protein